MTEENLNDDEEYLLDEITGARKKKPIMSLLNKGELSDREMDEIFLSEN